MKTEIINREYGGESIVFVECACFSHILRIEYDLKEKGLYLSMYDSGTGGGKLRWSERLRLIWHILTTGRNYADQLCLNDDASNQPIEKLKDWFKGLPE